MKILIHGPKILEEAAERVGEVYRFDGSDIDWADVAVVLVENTYEIGKLICLLELRKIPIIAVSRSWFPEGNFIKKIKWLDDEIVKNDIEDALIEVFS